MWSQRLTNVMFVESSPTQKVGSFIRYDTTSEVCIIDDDFDNHLIYIFTSIFISFLKNARINYPIPSVNNMPLWANASAKHMKICLLCVRSRAASVVSIIYFKYIT